MEQVQLLDTKLSLAYPKWSHRRRFMTIKEIDIIDENEISFPACPSSCRCECPPIVYQDASAKIASKPDSISNRVGDHRLESNQL